MNRLYLRLYAALVVAVLASLSLATTAAMLVDDRRGGPRGALPREKTRELVTRLEASGAGSLQEIVDEFAEHNDVDVVVWGADRSVLVYTGSEPARAYPDEPPMPPPDRRDWRKGPGRHMGGSPPPDGLGPGSFGVLDGGRIVATAQRRPSGPHRTNLWANGVLFLLLAIACLPIARLVTRRLETLEQGLETWSRGDLRTRLAVEGKDEIASVAEAFNRAAERIEKLLAQQRQILASASHELRSPLTRIRMALELLRGEEGRDGFRDRAFDGAAKDIEELDVLIGDILLAARAEGAGTQTPKVPVSLLPLLQGEAERWGLSATGEPAAVLGDRQLLRRMARNLFENALRYAGGEGVEIVVRRDDDRVVIEVRDRGPGIANSEKERIFEPFYRPPAHREGKHGGVGLGLVLVRQVAASHGGTAKCVDRDGGGTTFVVELPRVDEESGNAPHQ